MDDTCPCELCGNVTSFTGTKRCQRCWELERRIENDPAIARKVLNRVEMEKDIDRDRIENLP